MNLTERTTVEEFLHHLSLLLSKAHGENFVVLADEFFGLYDQLYYLEYCFDL